MPKVLKRFKDKETGRIYEVNKPYENADKARIDELVKAGYLDSAAENDSAEPKHVGGGVYELPNGERVKGKKEAIAAMKA